MLFQLVTPPRKPDELRPDFCWIRSTEGEAEMMPCADYCPAPRGLNPGREPPLRRRTLHLEKILKHFHPVLGEDRLRMELDPVDRVLLMH